MQFFFFFLFFAFGVVKKKKKGRSRQACKPSDRFLAEEVLDWRRPCPLVKESSGLFHVSFSLLKSWDFESACVHVSVSVSLIEFQSPENFFGLCRAGATARDTSVWRRPKFSRLD